MSLEAAGPGVLWRDTSAVVGEAPPKLGAVEDEVSVKSTAGGQSRDVAAVALGDPFWPGPGGSSGPKAAGT